MRRGHEYDGVGDKEQQIIYTEGVSYSIVLFYHVSLSDFRIYYLLSYNCLLYIVLFHLSHMPPKERETPNWAGLEAFMKSIDALNDTWNMSMQTRRYIAAVFNPEVIVPVTVPSWKLHL